MRIAGMVLCWAANVGIGIYLCKRTGASWVGSILPWTSWALACVYCGLAK